MKDLFVPEIGVLVGLVIFSITYAAPVLAGANTVSLCHVADGSPHTILVNENATDAHLAHADTLGTCGVEPPVCGPGITACGSTCNDLSTDENHCGACGFMCPIGTYCAESSCVEISEPPLCDDADGDGVLDGSCGGTDCNDLNATVYPGAQELCGDLLDNDCNGIVDDRDQDQDLHILESCSSYTGPLPIDDCRDTNDGVHGGALEVCGDSFDNNCDGSLNEGCP